MLDNFWTAIAEQITELKTAKNADDVVNILGTTVQAEATADAFFAGSGGDDSVRESLYEAGWHTTWWEADYYWVMQAPDGSKVTYVEGDVYKGDTHFLGRDES